MKFFIEPSCIDAVKECVIMDYVISYGFQIAGIIVIPTLIVFLVYMFYQIIKMN